MWLIFSKLAVALSELDLSPTLLSPTVGYGWIYTKPASHIKKPHMKWGQLMRENLSLLCKLPNLLSPAWIKHIVVLYKLGLVLCELDLV